MKKTKVLIIDDHVLFSEGLALILNNSDDFEVVGQVHDSRQAVHEFCCKLPELLLIDYNMPFLSGVDVVEKIQKQFHQCKIVILSMYADTHAISTFQGLKVNGYVTKTTPPNELLSALREVMDGSDVFLRNQTEKATSSLKEDSFILKSRLTNRELDILTELKIGKTTREISESLGLSYYTVETHRKNINKKLKLNSRKDLYKFLETL